MISYFVYNFNNCVIYVTVYKKYTNKIYKEKEERLIYDEVNNNFVKARSSRIVKTMFKPKINIKYWEDEIEKTRNEE